jgi:hypothetical protein
MRPTLTFKSDAWIHQVNERARILGVSVPQVLRSESRLWAGQIMRLTPPVNAAGMTGGDGKKLKPKTVGERAVRRDILRAMTPADPDWPEAPKFLQRPSIRKLVLAGDVAGFLKVIGRFKEFKNWKVVPFSPAVHRAAQGSRGRVSSNKKQFIIGAGQLADFWKYLVRTVNHVGRMKAGFAVSFIALGGSRVPHFIRRHLGGARGSIRFELSTTARHPYVEITNFAKGVGSAKMGELVRSTFKARVNAMQRRTRLLLKFMAKGDADALASARSEYSFSE